MIEFIAERVWDILGAGPQTGPRSAAFAYVGRDAPQVLPLSQGDVLLCDGSDANLTAGVVSPDALRSYMDAGVECWSLAGLHAKVLVYGHTPKVAVIGSANLSAHSRDHLGEAAVRTDDPEIVAAALDQIALWSQSAELLDRVWLNRALKLYRPPVGPRTRRRESTRPVSAPLWVTTELPLDREPPTAVQRAKESARRTLQFGYDTVEVLRLDVGDEDRVGPGHVIMRVEAGSDEEPRGNRKLKPWAVVHEVLPPAGQTSWPWAVLVSDSTTEPRPTVKALRDALKALDLEVDWSADTPLGQGAAAEVWSLWEE
ncbi:MAG TPA: hypothetical protein VGK17_00530 [Propionicimonas sp.]|jgi:hypothetical protein